MSDIDKLIGCYSDMMFRIAIVRMANKEDAEDAVQEAFLKYIKKQPKLESEEHAKAWLIKTTLNVCRDELRKRKFRSHEMLDDVVIEYSDNESGREIIRSLMLLPEKLSTVMMLYYVEGFKIRHIAEALGLTESAVKMRLKKGRELFKEICYKEGII